MKKIAQCDPLASYLARKDRIDQAMREVCEGGFYILGRRTAAFEEEFAAFCGARRAIGVANGTDAIELVLRAMELPPGSFVATVSNTAVATVSAIERAGCRPLFVDIDEEDFTISPDALEEVLKSSDGAQVKAVVAVHLFGHPADVERLRAITEPRGIRLIEDCAQAHGASVDGRRTGSLCEAAAFSFYPTKNLGAIGDGGAITTDDEALAERISCLRQYGWKTRYVSAFPGVNSRLDELQAAILSVKLAHLEEDNRARAEAAAIYSKLLDGVCRVPKTRPGRIHAWHQYVIRVPERDLVAKALAERGCGSAVHYPVPIHKQDAYLAAPAPLPLRATERVMAEILSLPMHQHLGVDDARTVAENLVSILGRN
jgi:dTDP-4-amino-4,6-dideoxygalactose transaminase